MHRHDYLYTYLWSSEDFLLQNKGILDMRFDKDLSFSLLMIRLNDFRTMFNGLLKITHLMDRQLMRNWLNSSNFQQIIVGNSGFRPPSRVVCPYYNDLLYYRDIDLWRGESKARIPYYNLLEV